MAPDEADDASDTGDNNSGLDYGAGEKGCQMALQKRADLPTQWGFHPVDPTI